MDLASGGCGPVAVVPVVPTEDPWRDLDVLTLRVHQRPLVTHLVSRVQAAGVRCVVGVAGEVHVPATGATVVRADPAHGYGGVLEAALREVSCAAELVLVHDVLSPLTPAALIRRLVTDVRASGRPAALTREVSETVKSMRGGQIGETVPRDLLSSVHAPLAMPVRIARALTDDGVVRGLRSFVELYATLRTQGHLAQVRGSLLSQGFADRGSLQLLECAEEALAAAGATGR